MGHITTMTTFKILLVFFVAFLKFENCITAPISEKECPTELNLEKNIVQELLRITSFKSEDDGQFAESVGCVWKNEGLVSEDGVINEENFRRQMVKEFRKEFPTDVAEEKAEDVLSYCKNVKGKNAAETSVNMIKCLGKWKTQAFIDYERKQSY